MVDAAKEWFRGWFAKIWKVRGGGLYAVGWAITFAWLEVTTVVDEFLEADGVVDFFTGQLMEFVLRFMSDSFINMGLAFMWPAHVVAWQKPAGIILLIVAFALFPIFVKPYLTAWLFPDGEPEKESKP